MRTTLAALPALLIRQSHVQGGEGGNLVPWFWVPHLPMFLIMYLPAVLMRVDGRTDQADL
jgi:hypothetical protein